MKPAEVIIASTRARDWLKADATQRAVVFDALEEVCGQQFELAKAVGNLDGAFPFLIHRSTWLGFYVVFGERVLPGFSEAELSDLVAMWGLSPSTDPEDFEGRPDLLRRACEQLMALRAQGPIDVGPVLLAETVLDQRWFSRLGAANRNELVAAVERYGWRLPTEPELELARILHARVDMPVLGTGTCTADHQLIDRREDISWAHEVSWLLRAPGVPRRGPSVRPAVALPSLPFRADVQPLSSGPWPLPDRMRRPI